MGQDTTLDLGGLVSRASAFQSATGTALVRPLCSKTGEQLTHELSKKYVYLYRDPHNLDIRYVGRGTLQNGGRGKQRVETHENCRQESCRVRPWVAALLAKGLKPVIEVIDCGDDDDRVRAVEGALISALGAKGKHSLLNRINGEGELFRPLGSPHSVAGRRLKDRLTRSQLAKHGPTLVVNLSIKNFTEMVPGSRGRPVAVTRPGAGTFSALTDRKVQDRIRAWWQIGNLRDEWLSGARPLPRLVIGVMGPVQHKWVYGSLVVDRKRIADMGREPGGLYSMPVKQGVDAAELRGRVLAPYQFGPRETVKGRVFGSVRSHQFDWVQ